MGRNDHHVTENADVTARKGRKKTEDDDPQLLPLTGRRSVKHGNADDLSSRPCNLERKHYVKAEKRKP